jgi:hypothetical protein
MFGVGGEDRWPSYHQAKVVSYFAADVTAGFA